MSTADDKQTELTPFSEEWENSVIEEAKTKGYSTEVYLAKEARRAAASLEAYHNPTLFIQGTHEFMQWSEARHERLSSAGALSSAIADEHLNGLEALTYPEEADQEGESEGKTAWVTEKDKVSKVWENTYEYEWRKEANSGNLTEMSDMRGQHKRLVTKERDPQVVISTAKDNLLWLEKHFYYDVGDADEQKKWQRERDEVWEMWSATLEDPKLHLSALSASRDEDKTKTPTGDNGLSTNDENNLDGGE